MKSSQNRLELPYTEHEAVSPSETDSNDPIMSLAGARFLQRTTQPFRDSSRHDVDGLPASAHSDAETVAYLSTSRANTSLAENLTTDITDNFIRVKAADAPPTSHQRDDTQASSSFIRRRVRESQQPEVGTNTHTAHTYPPSETTMIESSYDESQSLLITKHQTVQLGSHSPIPAITVFARKAAPLYLPKLDKYLSNLLLPELNSPISGDVGHSANSERRFPPFDLLAESGRTLEDLETSSQISKPWRNRNTIFGSVTNMALGIMGSSALAGFYSLQGLFNTIQVFALILSTIVPGSKGEGGNWRQLFLGTIPNILAFNFASTLVQSLIFLLVFMTIAAILLYYFYRFTARCRGASMIEGLRQDEAKNNSIGLLVVTFILTVIYLPLSTMALHVLVWSQDLWVVPNPYTNTTSFPPTVPPLGPSDQFRDPLDFCYTTTMRRNDVNFAPLLVILAALIVLLLTVWFPMRLRQIIKQVTPVVDTFTELGAPRSQNDMDREYQRLLARNHNSFAFLYKGFRRGWGAFEAFYLLEKLTTLLIIAMIDPNNCLFRSFSRQLVPVARQVTLLVAMFTFFLIHCIVAPFLNPVMNASEFTSRMNYVITSALSLGVALDVPNKKLLTGPLLYLTYVVTYGLSIYFTLIDTSMMHNVVKRLSRRIDFSIDIFSPRLDISSSSTHTRRRIWQETITALLLTSADCRIPEQQKMVFAHAPDAEYPPYLLDFLDSPGERHVENLKILREVGLASYARAVSLMYGPDHEWFKHLVAQIEQHFVGPDCYWKSSSEKMKPGCTKFFGNGWWVPFPPTLVIRFDNGPLAVICEVSDFQLYLSQNMSQDIQKKRQIRMALRALNGQRVTWPYNYIKPVGSRSTWCCFGRRYRVHMSVPCRQGILRIKHRGELVWRGLQFGSGLNIEILYDNHIRVDGGVIGLDDDYDLTPSLARFLELNRHLIPKSLAHIEEVIRHYRAHNRRECRIKADVLSYRFLSFVYDQPREPAGLAESSIAYERDLRVRMLMVGSEEVFRAAYERLVAVSAIEATTWWYLFWDDFWRRNNQAFSNLRLHASEFDPHFPTSIAYKPLPRPALETFLTQRGLFQSMKERENLFTTGFLNKLYLRLNEIVFRGSSKAVMFHIGNNSSELAMGEVDAHTLAGPSTLGTGNGTDHDDASVRARPAYRWEGILNDPLRKDLRWKQKLFAKVGAWFGITPLWRSGTVSKGLSLDVKLERGRYVLINE